MAHLARRSRGALFGFALLTVRCGGATESAGQRTTSDTADAGDAEMAADTRGSTRAEAASDATSEPVPDRMEEAIPDHAASDAQACFDSIAGPTRSFCGGRACDFGAICFHGCPLPKDLTPPPCGETTCKRDEICRTTVCGVRLPEGDTCTVSECVPGPEAACGTADDCCYGVCGSGGAGLVSFSPELRTATCGGA
jgi:hypothetical protein